MSYLDIVKTQLRVDEGVRNKPYRDTVGKLTIGVGHNLDDKPISARAIEVILEDDVADAETDARALFPEFESLSDGRKAVLLNMSLNLGRERLAGFHDMRTAISGGDFDKAATAMLDSKWAVQVGNRAQRLAKLMREG
jgi:lysozyme